MVRGMEIVGGGSHPTPCKPCITGKQTRSEILKHTETRSDNVLERVFSDVCGKLPTRSHSGYEYFATFIDDKSRKVFVVGLRHESDVARHLKDFIARAETETGKRVKILRSDGGGEYIGSAVTEYLKGKGIVKQELTTADTPQHNGVAERMNRTLLNNVRAMLADADLPNTFWFEDLTYAAHLHNLSPPRALENMTPEEAAALGLRAVP
jgi:transposase InsO family protein